MLDWIVKNSEMIITAAVILFVAIYAIALAISGKWEQLRADAFRLILLAEAAYSGSKRGQEKFAAVLDLVWNMIPVCVKFFIGKDTAKRKLQEWYNEIKDYMDNGKNDNSTNGVNLFP